MERQALLEIEMQGRGATRYRERAAKAISRNDATGTKPGTFITQKIVEPLTSAISDWLAEVNSGRAGPRNRAALLLDGMDLEVVSYLTAKVSLSHTLASHAGLAMYSRGTPLTVLANAVASAVEDEQRMLEFQRANPGLFAKVNEGLQADGSSNHHRRTVLVYAMNKFDMPWDRWPLNDRVRLGTKLIELLQLSTGAVRTELGYKDNSISRGAKKQVHLVNPDEKIAGFFMDELSKGELLEPYLMPTIIPPKEWSDLMGGGYHTNAVRPYGLIKGAHRLQRRMIRDKGGVSPIVLGGVNLLQNTPWRVNSDVLTIVRAVVEHGLLPGVKEIAQHHDFPVPPRPDPDTTSEEAMRDWRHAAAKAHVSNLKLTTMRIRQRSLLDAATRFEREDAMFFPHQLDFRGRGYPVPVLFNPQGSDLTKSLMTFRNGIELGTETAADWLKIHGANVWGNDKVTFEERIDFIEEMTPEILAYADDPLSNPGWTEADKPWSFLAFCFEYVGYMREGLRFKSRIPIALDGSCNGLQHFSAMLRDPVGGRAVNLTPSDKPQDIYQAVADRAVARLLEIADAGGEAAWMAETWAQFGLDRKVTKRPVMVLPYGGTPRSCLKYVDEAIRERIAKGQPNPFGDELTKAIAYLSKVIWDSIGDVVVAARAAMDWLQAVARVVSKSGQSIIWTTPSGFIAHQGYWDRQRHDIKTVLHGSIVKLKVDGDPIKIDSRKQATGISPNFVHSMDAAAMFLTMNLLAQYGVVDFAMIHDSYGTHAANTEAMSQAIRQAFVNMYQVDVLNRFRDEVIAALPPELASQVPPVPPAGALVLAQVLSAEFFFA